MVQRIMQSRILGEDVGEGLELLARALINKLAANALAWKTRRFHVFVYREHPVYEDHRFEHAYAAGGL